MTKIERKIAVVLTVHDRCEKTLTCLSSLYKNRENIDVFMTDDGCKDDTKSKVSSLFPKVNIVEGNGKLYWNRGMYHAFGRAIETRMYDYYLWVNDDTVFANDMIERLLLCASETNDTAIICGATVTEKDFNTVTYGGYTDQIKPLSLSDELQYCSFASGNILMIPSTVQQKVGNLDYFYSHALGDFDYEARARKCGFKIVQAPGWMGICERHSKIPKWRDLNYGVVERIKHLYSPLGKPPIEYIYFDVRNHGILLAIFHFFTIHARCLFPKLRKSHYFDKE